MPVRFTFGGKDFFGFEVFQKNLNKNLRIATFQVGLLVRSTATRTLQRGPPRSGKPRPGGGKRSAKGEFPKSDTGRLAQSFLVVNRSNNVVTVGVFGNVRYALYLEEGTRHMEARPFLKPSFDKNQRPIKKLIEKAILNST